MESLLKPYIKKQILLEADEEEKQIRKLREKMTTLVWDIANDESFANELSKWVNMPEEKFVRHHQGGNSPKSKHLSRVEIKNMIQAGVNTGPHTVWMNWKANTNPPRPNNAKWEDQFIGSRTTYEWSKAPSGDFTPATMGDLYPGIIWPKEIASLKVDAEGEAARANDDAAVMASKVKPKPEMQKMSDVDWNRYKWRNWGKIDVAQQMSNWSNDPGQKKDALKREIHELLKIFGDKEYITGKEARNIKTGKLSAFKKVFMSIGQDPEKSFLSNDQYAVKLISPDLLQGFLNDEHGLYFDKQGDEFFWRTKPAGGDKLGSGGSTGDTVGKEGGWFSDDDDPKPYVDAFLSYATIHPDKIKKYILKQANEPDPYKARHAVINLGSDKHGVNKIPAKIFMDKNYVNQHWKYWATNNGTKETLPIWDGKGWKENTTGKTSADTEDIISTRRKALKLAGSDSLSKTQKQQLVKMSMAYYLAMLEDMEGDHQAKGHASAFKQELASKFDASNMFTVLMKKNPNITADMLDSFRQTIRVSGTLKKLSGENVVPTTVKPPGGLRFNNTGAIVRDSANLNLRNLINLTTPLFEAPPEIPIDSSDDILATDNVTDAELVTANAILKAMGMSGTWRFVQPDDNRDQFGDAGVKRDVGGHVTTVRDIHPKTGEVTVKQYGNKKTTKQGVEKDGKKYVGTPVKARNAAEAELAVEIANFNLGAGTLKAKTAVAQIEKTVDELGINTETAGREEMAQVIAAFKESDWATEFVENPKDDDLIMKGDDEKVDPTIVKPPVPPVPKESKLTQEQIDAIKRRLSKGGHKAGPRDPGLAWDDNLQKILKIGASGSTADFKTRWKEVADIVTNSTSPTPPTETLDGVGATVIKAGDPMKMYDDALKSGPGAEIMQQVLDSDEKFASVWNARKGKTFKLPGHVAIFYYFGWPIQVAVNDEEYVALKKKEAEKSDAPPDASSDDTADDTEKVDQTTVKPPEGKYSIKITQNPRGRNDRWPEVTNVIDPSGKVVKSWQAKNNREPAQIRVAAQDYVNKMNAQASAGSAGGSIDDHFINVLGKEKYEIWKKVTGALSNNEKICVLAMMKKGFDLKLRPATESVQLDEGALWSLMKPLVKMALTSAITKMSLKGFGPAMKMIKDWTKMSDNQVVAFLKNAKKSGKLDNWMNISGIEGMRADAKAFAKGRAKGIAKNAGGDAATSGVQQAQAKAASMKVAKDASVQGVKAGKSAAPGTLTKVKDLIKKHPKKAGAVGAYGAWKLFFDKNEELDCDTATLIHKIQQAGGDLVNTGHTL